MGNLDVSWPHQVLSVIKCSYNLKSGDSDGTCSGLFIGSPGNETVIFSLYKIFSGNIQEVYMVRFSKQGM
jgi:hypothetical protein